MRNVNVVHQSLTQSSSCSELNNQLVSFSQFIYYKKPKLFKIIIHKIKFFKTSNLIMLMNVFDFFCCTLWVVQWQQWVTEVIYPTEINLDGKKDYRTQVYFRLVLFSSIFTRKRFVPSWIPRCSCLNSDIICEV